MSSNGKVVESLCLFCFVPRLSSSQNVMEYLTRVPLLCMGKPASVTIYRQECLFWGKGGGRVAANGWRWWGKGAGGEGVG